MFNKVITGQYYMWFMAFWPVVLVNNRLMHDKSQQLASYFILWALGQTGWGYFANAFETNGEHTLVQIQVSNFVWLAINLLGAMLFLKN